MKKYLFLASVAALSFTACTNETEEFVGAGSENQQKEIAFFPLNQNATRAAGAAATNAVDAVTYPSNYTMYVVAYSAGKGDYFGAKEGDNYTGAGVPFLYQYAGGESASGTNPSYWGGNPAQYWPLSEATLNFLAVSNWATTTVVSATQPVFGTSGTSYTNLAEKVVVTLGDNKPDGSGRQHDLMYGNGAASVTTSGNVVVCPDAAPVTFKHALAWVKFNVKAATATETAIKVKKITLTGANYGGTFQAKQNNYNNTAGLSWDAANTKWTAVANNSNNEVPGWSETALTTGGADVGKGLMIVPTYEITPAAVSFTSFTIQYVLNGITYDYTYTPTDAEKTLEKGKKYLYNITFKLHEIYIDASVSNWTDGGTTYVDIPTTTIAYNESTPGAFTATAEGTYSFTITGVPAHGENTYSIVEDSGDDIITSVVKAADTTPDSGEGKGTITVNVKLNGTAGTKALKLKLGASEKMTINVTKS